MGRILEDDVARVRDATDIVELIAESLVLTRKGRLYWGLCPFHAEKTPSFKVDPSTQLWHCFGCGEGGDAFGFLMQREHFEFPESVRVLAERARIEITETGGAAVLSKRERLVAACDAAADYFHHELTRSRGELASAARAYLSSRGMSVDVARRFTIGYAPGDRALVSSLKGRGFSADEIVEANLGVLDRNGRLADRFFRRVMFPIRDVHGRVIAFGGRVVDSGEPKYLNSSDTPIFHKSSALYALDKAKGAIADKGNAIVVEGYTDVIALHEAGVANVVATLGTALTRQHVNLLARFSDRIICLFDGDEAGVRAANRAVEFIDAMVARRHGRDVDMRVVLLPDALDPADFVALHGADALEPLLSHAEPVIRFAIDQRLAAYDLTTPEGRDRALRDSARILAPVRESVLGQEYANYLADRVRVAYATARAAIEAAAPGEDRTVPDDATLKEHLDGPTRAERALAGVVALVPAARAGARRLLDSGLLEDPAARAIIEVAASLEPAASADELYRAVADRDSRAAKVLTRLLVDASAPEDVQSVLRDVVVRLKDNLLERAVRESQARYRECEASGDAPGADEQFRRVVALQAEREALRRGALPEEAKVWGLV